MAGIEASDVRVQLGGAPVGGVALFGVGLLLQERHRPLGGLEAGAQSGQLFVDGPACVARLGQPLAVQLELVQRRLAAGHLSLEASDFGPCHLQLAGVLGALGAVAADRVLELLLGGKGAAVGAAHRLLQPVAQRALVLLQAGELLVMDAGRGAEELLGRQTRQAGHDVLDGCRVGRDDLALAQLDGAPATGEDLGDLARLAILLERDGHRRRAVLGAPSAQPVELVGCRGRPPEEAHLDRPLERALAGLVGPTHDVQTRLELHRQVDVALDVLQTQSGDQHG